MGPSHRGTFSKDLAVHGAKSVDKGPGVERIYSGIGNSTYKGPEVGTHLTCFASRASQANSDRKQREKKESPKH